MAKVLCIFDDVEVMCKVTENMGYQGGDYVKAVEHDGVERIVIKRGSVWVPKPAVEKMLLETLTEVTCNCGKKYSETYKPPKGYINVCDNCLPF